MEEFEQLTAMVNDMLLLTKADHGLFVPDQQTLDMAPEVDSLLKFYLIGRRLPHPLVP